MARPDEGRAARLILKLASPPRSGERSRVVCCYAARPSRTPMSPVSDTRATTMRPRRTTADWIT